MLVDILTSKLFLINWLIGILLVEFSLYKTKVVRKVNEDRDSKYPAFRRVDVHKWKRPLLYIGAVLLPIKVILSFCIIVFYVTFLSILMIG